MSHQPYSGRVSGPAKLTHDWLVRLGYRRALLLVVGTCTLAAVGLVAVLMAVFDVALAERSKGIVIATLVPAPIAGILAHMMLTVVFELERTRSALNEIACRDSLTQVFNRGHFVECLSIAFQTAREGGRPLSLLMIDIDHFKAVNDEHGHPAGDRVLQALALACRDGLQEEDVVARFGGEEFVVLAPDLAASDAFELAERLRRRISELRVPLEGGQSLGITASIGVGTTVADEDHWEALIARADAALYRAKREGRNRSSSCFAWVEAATSGTA
jgi:diguanylate cyclase (GGDEF)-like protein